MQRLEHELEWQDGVIVQLMNECAALEGRCIAEHLTLVCATRELAEEVLDTKTQLHQQIRLTDFAHAKIVAMRMLSEELVRGNGAPAHEVLEVALLQVAAWQYIDRMQMYKAFETALAAVPAERRSRHLRTLDDAMC